MIKIFRKLKLKFWLSIQWTKCLDKWDHPIDSNFSKSTEVEIVKIEQFLNN